LQFWFARDLRNHRITVHDEDIDPGSRSLKYAGSKRPGTGIDVVGKKDGADETVTLIAPVPRKAIVHRDDPVSKPKRKPVTRKGVPAALVPSSPRRSPRKTAAIDLNEGNRAVESLDLDGLQNDSDLYQAVHDQAMNETVYVLQDAYNMGNVQVHQQPHTIMTRSQQHQYQMQQQQYGQFSEPQQIVVVAPNQQQVHHQPHHQVHQSSPQRGRQFTQLAPVNPAVDGDCKMCGTRIRDIRRHYIEFHRIKEQQVHFFMAA
jgi:hypothetical protein